MSSKAIPFSIADVASERLHTIVVSGEMDLAAAPEFSAALDRVCAKPPATVVLDLTRLTFLDSSAIQAILAGCEQCRQAGHEPRVVPGPQNIQRVFELTGVLHKLPFASNGARPTDHDNGLAVERSEAIRHRDRSPRT